MTTAEELKILYQNKGNQELLNIVKSESDYTPEAVSVARELIEERGGYNIIENEVNAAQAINKQLYDIRIKVYGDLIKKTARSIEEYEKIYNLLQQDQIANILTEQTQIVNDEKVDKTVKVSTVFKSIIGGAIGSIVSSALWGYFLIASEEAKNERVPIILIIGMWLICYGVVKFVTKKSYRNFSVLVFSALSLVFSFELGRIVFLIFR